MADQTPAAQPKECACCFDDLRFSGEGANGVEYRVNPSAPWCKALYCEPCLEVIMDSKFETYMKAVEKADCAAELRRLLDKGPPIFIADPQALPVGEGEHVDQLHYASDDRVVPAIVKNAVTGEAHKQLWDKLKAENLPRLDQLPEEAPA